MDTDQFQSLPQGRSVLFELLLLTDSLDLENMYEELTKKNCN